MKKTLKSIALLAIVAIMVVALTGCGNKLTATRTSSEMGVEVKETVEVKFKSDKAEEVKMTYEFEDEDTASDYYALMNAFLPEGTVEQKGKKITIEITAKDFSDFGEDLEGASKKEVKEQLEDAGYEVK